MTFALATLAFLAAIWLAIVVFAGTFEDYGSKVLAALASKPPVALPVPAMSLRLRPRYPATHAVRHAPRLRAAA